MTRIDAAAANRAKFPELAEKVSELRAAGGEVRIVWAANAEGDQLGPVPDGWDKDWPEVPYEITPKGRAIAAAYKKRHEESK